MSIDIYFYGRIDADNAKAKHQLRGIGNVYRANDKMIFISLQILEKSLLPFSAQIES